MSNVKPTNDNIDVKPSSFAKSKEAIEAILKGMKLGAPLPEFKQPYEQEKRLRALRILEQIQDAEPSQIKRLVQDAYDLLDDAKINKSRQLPDKTVKIITQVASVLPVAAYLIYAIITGDFDVSALLSLIGL